MTYWAGSTDMRETEQTAGPGRKVKRASRIRFEPARFSTHAFDDGADLSVCGEVRRGDAEEAGVWTSLPSVYKHRRCVELAPVD